MNQLAVADAKSSENENIANDQNLYLTFQVSSEAYGVSILGVKEILEYGEITSVPMVPDFIQGVINVRGSVVPVIDLARRIARPVSPVTKRTCIVITEIACDDEILEIGVVVDSVNEVLEIAACDIEDTPAFGAKIRTDFIQGMGKVDNRFIILLDIKNVLSVEELSLLNSVSGASQEPSKPEGISA